MKWRPTRTSWTGGPALRLSPCSWRTRSRLLVGPPACAPGIRASRVHGVFTAGVGYRSAAVRAAIEEAGSPRMPAKVMRTDTVRAQTLMPIAMVSSA